MRSLSFARRRISGLFILLLVAAPLVALAGVPGLTTNAALTLPEGATSRITSAQLNSSDNDTRPLGVTYRLDRSPMHGRLELSRPGLPRSPFVVPIGFAFTQDDINNGYLTYTNDGSAAASDSFDFTLADRALPSLELVSSFGEPSDFGRVDLQSSLSDDGRYVAFYSYAPNLVSGDTNNVPDIFVRDRQTNQVSRVSLSNEGVQANGASYSLAISANGRYVAFSSEASNLVNNDTNNASDIFVRDLQNNTTVRVSVASDGTQGNAASYNPTISANGRYIAFASSAYTLVSNDTNNYSDIFVYDMSNNTITRESVASDGTQANASSATTGYSTGYSSVSTDGRFIVFESLASNIVPNDVNGEDDVFVRDRNSKTTTRISLGTNGSDTDNASMFPSMSSDGRYVVFSSFADNIVAGDTNNTSDIFLLDLVKSQTTRISVSTGGQQGNSYSYEPAISADGRSIIFYSYASNLVSNDSNGVVDVFIRDTQAKTTRRISVADDGTQGNKGSSSATISGNGRVASLFSSATNLVGGDTDGQTDIFVYDTGTPGTFPITITQLNDPPTLIAPVDQTLPRNAQPSMIPFSVGDEETDPSDLVVTAESSDPSLLTPIPGGDGTRRTLALAPTANKTGSTSVTVKVSDGVNTTSKQFVVTVAPPPAAPAPPWLVLLYLAGDDKSPPPGGSSADLNEAIKKLLANLESMPANPNMRLVVLSDGNQNGDMPDGNLNGDSKLAVRQPGATGLTYATTIPAEITGGVASDEVNMGSTVTLRNFIAWARATYPGSAHTMLSIVDHGGGWAPDLGDPGQPQSGGGGGQPNTDGWRGLSLDALSNDALSTRNLGEALSGQPRLDVLFLDACLMSMIETAEEAQPYADYLVAGENLLWAQLPYSFYLGSGALNATTSPAQLATTIVNRYNKPAYPDEPFTIAALDLAKLPDLRNKTNALALALLNALPPADSPPDYTHPTAPAVPLENPVRAAITRAYSASQKFDSDASYSIDAAENSVDLADFARQLQRPENRISTAVNLAAQAVIDATVGAQPSAGVVIATSAISGTLNGSSQPWNFAGANGLGIYLPLGELDCRPTGQPIADPNVAAIAPCVALPNSAMGQPIVEPQLRYYANPSQLAFTRNAPHWADLLLRLEDGTQPRKAKLGSFDQEQPPKRTYYGRLPLVQTR